MHRIFLLHFLTSETGLESVKLQHFENIGQHQSNKVLEIKVLLIGHI